MADIRTDLGQALDTDPPGEEADSVRCGAPETNANILSRRRRVLTVFGLLMAVMVSAALILFLQFAEKISGMTAPVRPQADGIVVLTGGKARVLEGLRLLEAGHAKRLLISGVHPGTTRAQLAAVTESELPLGTCCVDLDRQALNTQGNAAGTASWAHKYGYKRLLVVTSAYHVPRASAEMQNVLPDADLIAYPVFPAELDLTNWYRHPRTIRLLMREYVKYILARLRIVTSS